jgi:hypothetical protein
MVFPLYTLQPEPVDCASSKGQIYSPACKADQLVISYERYHEKQLGVVQKQQKSGRRADMTARRTNRGKRCKSEKINLKFPSYISSPLIPKSFGVE